MQLVQHYNDLTEINHLRYGIKSGYSASSVDLMDDLEKIEKQIKTRIAFTDVKTSYPETIKMMDKAGWKIARKTLDWHVVHRGDSELRLYYKIFPENNSDPKDKQKREAGTYLCHRSLAGSCSMGLIDNLGADWLKSPGYPERYLTLIRLDRKRTKKEIAKMRYFRYRLVFKSDVARYFANGWHPDEYMGRDKEHEWWGTKEAPTING